MDGGHNRATLLRESAHVFHHLIGHLRIETASGLVEQQQRRIAQQRQSNICAFPLAARDSFDQARRSNDCVCAAHEPKLLHDRNNSVILSLFVHATLQECCRKLEILAGRQGLVHCVVLCHVANATPATLNAVAVVRDGPCDLARDATTHNAVEQSGLAGTRWSHQGNDVASVDLEIHILKERLRNLPFSLARNLDVEVFNKDVHGNQMQL
mmetsp:Transcript_25943/g.72381  ORF Transcript_25943/g.72381 Transcript_25943/m.72381 type:complete len:211 (-) Transcript_25943:106-738(-)